MASLGSDEVLAGFLTGGSFDLGGLKAGLVLLSVLAEVFC